MSKRAPTVRTGAGTAKSLSGVHALDLPLSHDPETGWKVYHQFQLQTPLVGQLTCHVSVLSPGATPHEPHQHAEEEVLIVLAGEADLRIAGRDGAETQSRVRPGNLVYYPAGQSHTIHNPEDRPLTYLMLKWRGRARGDGSLQAKVYSYDELSLQDVPEGYGWSTQLVFQGPTGYLARLHCHVSTLLPGGGYQAHADSHDLAIVVLKGTIETLGSLAGPWTVIFCAAGESHGMHNPGDEGGTYLVFEFHGEPDISTRLMEKVEAAGRLAQRWAPSGSRRGRLLAALSRARAYWRGLGPRAFAWRLLRPWLWLPRLLNGPTR